MASHLASYRARKLLDGTAQSEILRSMLTTGLNRVYRRTCTCSSRRGTRTYTRCSYGCSLTVDRDSR
jgi:hypothetical protein